MTQPVQAKQTKQGRVYPLDGGWVPSVTTCLAMINKPMLVPSARKIAVLEVLENLKMYAELLEADGLEKTRLRAARAAKAVWDDKATRGNEVHAAIEAMVAGRYSEIPASLDGYMKHLDNWFIENTPIVRHSEITGYNRTHGFAGSIDLIMELDGHGTVCVDVKSGGLWPEATLQLAAYSRFEFIGTDDGKELPFPHIDACGLLHVTEDECELVMVDAGDESFEAFLAARRLWEWSSK